jgi:hypothetical protein
MQRDCNEDEGKKLKQNTEEDGKENEEGKKSANERKE